ncbi:MAG: efflux transporter outer membrane subunit [Gemmatimonadota bacterium]|jgi:NodT family efflux transporter outer membrane factor (OMF) lipoprotein|nr:transporter [Gemmatimonadota bacterium]MDP6461360.1 efflux transporter outer membrane subunit [Gemmatimonadota bacterium]MDP6528070.1 efflux transporter outer membrane subunit [Gemmatimonadota bacterium]
MRVWSPAAASLVAALLTAGCASSPPRTPTRLAPDFPSSFTAAPPDSAAGSAAGFWESLGDPRLPGLVEEALLHNRDLAAAAAGVEAAAAEARMAGAGLLPGVQAGLQRTRSRQVFVGLPIPGGSGGGISSTSTGYGASVDVSWEVDLWGRVRAAASAGVASYEATAAEYEAARLSIAAQTVKSWFAVVEARQQEELARATVGSYRAAESRVRERYRRGLRPSLDLRLLRAEAAGAEAVLADRRIALDRLTRSLEVLLGRYPAGEMHPEGPLPIPESVPAGLPADLLLRRPDLVAAERRLAAAGAARSEARRALLPRISLTASGGRTSSALQDLTEGDFSTWGLVAGVLQPLFQRGKLRARVAQAGAIEDQALAAWAGDVLGACAEVEGLLAADAHLAEAEAARREAARESQEAERLATERYESGLSDVIMLLQARRGAHAAESGLVAVRLRRLVNRVDLHLALGGELPPTVGDAPREPDSEG